MSNSRDLILRYGTLKLEIAKAETELEMIKGTVLKEIMDLRGETDSPIELTELPGCSFTVQKRKTWQYSPEVKELEARYKDRKKLEEQNGDATFTEKESLVFSTKSHD